MLSASRTSPRRTIDLVSDHGVTVLAAVPTLWAQIASVLRRDPDGARRLAALRTSISSGDRMPAGLAEEMAGLGCHLVDALGSSECGDVYLSEAGDGRGEGVLGRVTPGIEVRSGAGAAPLWVRTPCAALGYWGRPELTARLRRGAWTRTEDIVTREGGGYRLLGRADDLFKVGGRLVSPLEIERALAEHPLIAEAAVVGTPQRGGLTRPAAFVVTSGTGRGVAGLERELQRHVARRLAPDLAPGRVAVMATLPRLAGGKLDRRALSAVAAAAEARASRTPAGAGRGRGTRHARIPSGIRGDRSRLGATRSVPPLGGPPGGPVLPVRVPAQSVRRPLRGQGHDHDSGVDDLRGEPRQPPHGSVPSLRLLVYTWGQVPSSRA